MICRHTLRNTRADKFKNKELMINRLRDANEKVGNPVKGYIVCFNIQLCYHFSPNFLSVTRHDLHVAITFSIACKK